MTATNRVQIATVVEVTAGTTPTTPRMRLVRVTGESLNFTPEYVTSDEIRSDRMVPDPIKVMQASDGGINFELTYPDDNSPLSDFLRSAFFNTWTKTPTRDNDGTADSVITNVDNTTQVITVTTGAAFVTNHLVRNTGFTNAANNGVFKCTTGSATVPAFFVGSGLVLEAAPPAAAKMEVVGFQGASGDITATSTGLGSTALNFTTLGLAVGQWIKIGGTAAVDKFATAALNDWMRITAITATALTLDNRPSGWTTDAGTGKTIKVWFGDTIKNGTTVTSLSIEKGFLGQTTPTYIINTGMQVNTLSLSLQSRQKITGQVAFMGMGGSQSTTALDATPDAVTTGKVIAANANVGRVAEAGTALASPNWANQFEVQINNNLRTIEAVDSTSPVKVEVGECSITGRITSYFGSNSLLAKIYDGTVTSLNARMTKDSQALIIGLPRVTLISGNPQAGGKNQDAMLDANFQASIDSATSAHILLDRLSYFEV